MVLPGLVHGGEGLMNSGIYVAKLGERLMFRGPDVPDVLKTRNDVAFQRRLDRDDSGWWLLNYRLVPDG